MIVNVNPYDTGYDENSSRWNQPEYFELSWAIVSAITDNDEVRRGLYPEPGSNASTANGGGKRKADFHRIIVDEVFRDHPKYGALYRTHQDANDKKKLDAWKLKVKNRIRT